LGRKERKCGREEGINKLRGNKVGKEQDGKGEKGMRGGRKSGLQFTDTFNNNEPRTNTISKAAP
jgi:hypothetical protein